MTDERLTDSLTSLMRGEMTAAEAYELTVAGLAAEAPDLTRMLRRIHDDHAAAVEWFRRRIVLVGGDPPERSGPWGAFGSVIAPPEPPSDAKAVVERLLRGEWEGLASYDRYADGPALDAPTLEHVTTVLRPQQQGHIAMLEEFLALGTTASAGASPPAEDRSAAIAAILEAPDMDRDRRIAMLQQLGYEAREREVATEEGMHGVDPTRPSLQEIDAALASLGVRLAQSDAKH